MEIRVRRESSGCVLKRERGWTEWWSGPWHWVPSRYRHGIRYSVFGVCPQLVVNDTESNDVALSLRGL